MATRHGGYGKRTKHEDRSTDFDLTADFAFDLQLLYIVEFTALKFNCLQSQIQLVDLFDVNLSALLCQRFSVFFIARAVIHVGSKVQYSTVFF